MHIQMNLLKTFGLLTILACQTSAGVLDSNSHNLFSSDIYKEVIKSENENFAVCPLSVQIVMALAHAGAEGKTAQEIASALHLPQEKETIQEIFQKLLPQLRGNRDYSLSSVNRIYVKEGYQIWDSYTKIAKEVFGADVQTISFKKKKKAVAAINRWVETQTHDKIKNLLSVDDITKRSRSVLVNAMYFEAKWAKEFEEAGTFDQTFYINSTETVDVEMLHGKNYYNYYESKDLDAKFLEMPYVGGEATMTFVLPNQKDGLSALEENVEKIIKSPRYEHRKVYVAIPKFKTESKIDFNGILQNMGIHAAFSDLAQFKQIVMNKPLKIGKVAQKTFLEVKEAGTTAAAATFAIMIQSRFSEPEESLAEFAADHPFIYYIKINDVILFIGRYVAP